LYFVEDCFGSDRFDFESNSDHIPEHERQGNGSIREYAIEGPNRSVPGSTRTGRKALATESLVWHSWPGKRRPSIATCDPFFVPKCHEHAEPAPGIQGLFSPYSPINFGTGSENANIRPRQPTESGYGNDRDQARGRERTFTTRPDHEMQDAPFDPARDIRRIPAKATESAAQSSEPEGRGSHPDSVSSARCGNAKKSYQDSEMDRLFRIGAIATRTDYGTSMNR